MAEEKQTYRKWLLPLSYLYGLGVRIRNTLYNWNILKSKSYSIPIICVGNLTVGGTGKTPHIEYLIRLLQRQGLNIAILSRGYKRATNGYILATTNSTSREIGDEPCQMKRKFPDITVAVDENRCHGIENLLKLDSPRIDIILLDDAYQHRRVKAGLNILLTDFNNLFTDDYLLPAGNLREPVKEKERAQMVIVTKSNSEMKPIEFNILSKKLNLYPYQGLFFSTIEYDILFPLYPESVVEQDIQIIEKDTNVLLVTGIASPLPMVEKVKSLSDHVQHLPFPDHYSYKRKDMQLIEQAFNRMQGPKKIILTTEKDAYRLIGNTAISEEMKPYIYVLPIKMHFLQDREETFNQQIISYVRANKRNC